MAIVAAIPPAKSEARATAVTSSTNLDPWVQDFGLTGSGMCGLVLIVGCKYALLASELFEMVESMSPRSICRWKIGGEKWNNLKPILYVIILPDSKDALQKSSYNLIDSGGIKGRHGGIYPPPPSEALPPLAPSQKKKMAKISHFWQIFGFLPPQNRISPLDAPHQKKFWCRHCWLNDLLRPQRVLCWTYTIYSLQTISI